MTADRPEDLPLMAAAAELNLMRQLDMRQRLADALLRDAGARLSVAQDQAGLIAAARRLGAALAHLEQAAIVVGRLRLVQTADLDALAAEATHPTEETQ